MTEGKLQSETRGAPESGEKRWRAASSLCAAILISAFGPYLLPSVGLRLDHVVVYPVAAISLVLLVSGQGRRLPVHVWALLTLWLFTIIWMVTVSVTFGEASNLRAVVAALETQVQPLAVMMLMVVLLSRLTWVQKDALLEVALRWVLVLLCANAVLAILNIYVDTSSFVSHFITADASGFSVWGNAASMGRYTGVLGQPFEAGVAYSVGLIGWIFLVVVRGRRGILVQAAVVLVVIGGLLTVSKVFVLGGLPIALAYGLWEASRVNPGRIGRLLLWGAVPIGALTSLAGWTGLGYLLRLFDIGRIREVGLMYSFSAGRYGASGTSVQGLYERTLQDAPLRGFGLGSYAPLDSGWMEYLYQGGLVALLLYLGVILVICWNAGRGAAAGLATGRLQVVWCALIVGANFGAGALTANRVAILVWVPMMILISLSRPHAEPRVGLQGASAD